LAVTNTGRAQIIPNDPIFFGPRSLRRFQMTKVTDSDSEVSVTMWHLAKAQWRCQILQPMVRIARLATAGRAALRVFKPPRVCSGSISTKSSNSAGELMSALLRKRPRLRGGAICRDGPLPDSCTAADAPIRSSHRHVQAASVEPRFQVPWRS
jgi:hypothetical protein